MKKLILAAALICLTFTSCSDCVDEPAKQKEVAPSEQQPYNEECTEDECVPSWMREEPVENGVPEIIKVKWI